MSLRPLVLGPLAVAAAALALLAPAARAIDPGPISISDTGLVWVDGGSAIAYVRHVLPGTYCGYRIRCLEYFPTVIDLDGDPVGTAPAWTTAGGDRPAFLLPPPEDVVSWQPGGTRYAAYDSGGRYSILWVGDWRTGQRTVIDPAAGLLWSPDGRRLTSSVSSSGELTAYDVATGEQHGLGVSGRPLAWSADGSRLAILAVADAGGYVLRVVDVDTTTVARETTLAARPSSLSPGLDHAVVTTGDGGEHVLVDLRSGVARELEPGGLAAWSPDGRRLAFVTPTDALVVLDLVGGRTEPSPAVPGVQLGGSSGFAAPAWSPAGDRIAWLDPRGGLRIARTDGVGPVVHVHLGPPLPDRLAGGYPVYSLGEIPAPRVSWSPDGGWVAFDAGLGCTNGIKLVRPDGSDLRWLTNDCRIFGTDGDDRIHGTIRQDVVIAGAGDDVITTGKRSDLVLAGPGDDVVTTAGGYDSVVGGPGRDRIRGGAEDDLVLAGAGDDILLGGAGDDVLDGGPGLDTTGTDPRDELRSVERRLAEALA